MQLDKTQIVIRQRSYFEILDLALHVFRRYAGPLAAALALGIAPAFLLNAWLLSSLLDGGFDQDVPYGYMFAIVPLVVLEIPLATAPATLYLGQAVFQQQPSARRVAGDLVQSLPQLIVYQVIMRAVLVVLVVPWLWLFSQYAFLNEVILLERNPLRQKSAAKPSTGRRCRALHSGVASDLFARWLGTVLLGSVLLLSFWGSIMVLRVLLLSEWEMSTTVFTHCFQASLWMVVAFFAVVRFLSYLDTRIRREGWEVELIMRAESQRLAGPEAN